MLTFNRVEGQLRQDSTLIGLGYSGNGLGLNNPAEETIRGVGPLPKGTYTLNKILGSHLGPVVFRLDPDPENMMYGRSGFYIHWDNQQGNFSASDGCIVLVTTQTFHMLNDKDTLTVV